MAHSNEIKLALRKSYIFDGLPLTTCALKHGVSVGTAQNWKNKAQKAGDDWDKERDAYLMSSMGVEDASALMFSSFVKQFNNSMALLELPPEHEHYISNPLDRIRAQGMLADSYAKMLSSHTKNSPKASTYATALDVMTFFSDYIEKNNKDLLPEFSLLIEPFGVELSKRYG